MQDDERVLERDISIMEGQLRQKRLLRQVTTARAQQEDTVSHLMIAQDEHGRALYGTEAWDEGTDGSAPMKELFILGENELREIKIEAYNRIAAGEKLPNGGHGTLSSARVTSMTAMDRNKMAGLVSGVVGKHGNSNNEKLTEEEVDAQVMSPLLVTARTTTETQRSQHSRAKDAPFDDPRFVVPREDRPMGLPSMFPSLHDGPNGCGGSEVATAHYASNNDTTAARALLNAPLLHSGPRATTIFDVGIVGELKRGANQPGAKAMAQPSLFVTVQARGRTNPAPPLLPHPGMRRDDGGNNRCSGASVLNAGTVRVIGTSAVGVEVSRVSASGDSANPPSNRQEKMKSPLRTSPKAKFRGNKNNAIISPRGDGDDDGSAPAFPPPRKRSLLSSLGSSAQSQGAGPTSPRVPVPSAAVARTGGDQTAGKLRGSRRGGGARIAMTFGHFEGDSQGGVAGGGAGSSAPTT